MEAAQVDFQQLRIKHILFKSKVRSVLYGGSFDKAFFSPAGPVGLWFNTVGLKNYAHHPEMRHLFQIHQDLNTASLQVIGNYQQGQTELAHAGLQDIENISGQFLDILSRLDQKLAR
jgi:hypothetical protein